MTTNEIVDILFDGSREHHRLANGFKCYFSIYKCSLNRKNDFNLFEFEIDKSLSVFHPNISINIPDGEVDEIYNYDEKYNNDKLNYLMKLFPDEIIKKYGKELTYIVFSILHEVGHWEYICKNNYLPQEYEEKDSVERKLFYENNEDNGTEKAFWEYRKITSEKEADDYAMARLNRALETIVNNEKGKDERE